MRALGSDKNPAHDSALRIQDLTPGRRVIVFYPHSGSTHEYIVMARAGYSSPIDYAGLTVALRSVKSGETSEYLVEDLGVIPSPLGEWSDRFAIDYRKRNLLPRTRQSRGIVLGPLEKNPPRAFHTGLRWSSTAPHQGLIVYATVDDEVTADSALVVDLKPGTHCI